MTQKTVAEHLFWSQSKIIRIEQGNVPVAPSDVRVLLLDYGVTDEKRIIELMEMAKASRKPDEWAAYRDVFSSEAVTLFSNERVASIIQKYEPIFVPGLFQTEAYARALFTTLRVPDDKLEKRLELRLRRQDILDSDDSPEFDVIIGEAALSRPVGGPHVMRQQIERLKELAKYPKVTIQLLRFARGPHRGMGSSFTILQFEDEDLSDLLYQEDEDKATVVRDDRDALTRYGERFVELKELSADEDLEAELDAIVSRLYS